MSFLHDNLNPEKSAARNQRANAAKAEAECLKKKREKKKEEEEHLEKKRLKKEQEEKYLEEKTKKRLEAAEQLKAGSYYKGIEDIKREEVEENPEKAEQEESEGEQRKGTVTFNAGKRAAQIAACMTGADIKAVMGILAKDLSDCEMGVSEGMCDEAEVEKVRAMIKNAQKKGQQLAMQKKDGADEPQDDRLTINLLM